MLPPWPLPHRRRPYRSSTRGFNEMHGDPSSGGAPSSALMSCYWPELSVLTVWCDCSNYLGLDRLQHRLIDLARSIDAVHRTGSPGAAGDLKHPLGSAPGFGNQLHRRITAGTGGFRLGLHLDCDEPPCRPASTEPACIRQCRMSRTRPLNRPCRKPAQGRPFDSTLRTADSGTVRSGREGFHGCPRVSGVCGSG
jgi:hypothetical protein